ncbi:MAG: pyruvate, phosphate dikinase [Planctomycetota bacterium]|nr:MAG: pyruvate, phosphate dikinase [Planctomycetota bacterium]
MGQVDARLSTGFPGLDGVLHGLIPGDNIVWQVRHLELYERYAVAFARQACERGCSVHWFGFGANSHPPQAPGLEHLHYHRLDTSQGFEQFISGVHNVIDAHAGDGVYIFECLSELTADWYSDAMLVNFYMLTCPAVYDVGGLAYFSLIRHRHSSAATVPIRETAQVVIDAYHHHGHDFLHPVKVQHRHSSTMHMLHAVDGDGLYPVTQSAVAADVLATMPSAEVGISRNRPDVWHQVFHHAERLLQAARDGEELESIPDDVHHRLLRMVISRDDRVLELVRRYLQVDDLLDIGRRCIGTGLIGGKAVGMLVARAILQQKEPRFRDILEHHDSFFICSDVYYSYLVHNGIWWVRQRQRRAENLFRDAKRARQRILTGSFPPDMIRQCERMLAYFGQSPIIVRSSSLLEDNFGNAFAGKYESVFCVNQGMREQRLRDFLSAVRTIYASAMSDEALRYRHSRGLLDRDEQMALLVQRVSGTMHGKHFYPHVAGVGLSYNPFVWHPSIDPHAGMLRLVFGLGTRAVDRRDDDYTRIVALNAPTRSPGGSGPDTMVQTQRYADMLDLAANQVMAVPVAQALAEDEGVPVQMLSSVDRDARERARHRGRKPTVSVRRLDFHRLLQQDADGPQFIDDMRRMLAVLQEAYAHPVDIEFTANVVDGELRIDLVQCRPLQFLGHVAVEPPPQDIAQEHILLSAPGPVIGQSRCTEIDRIVLVDASGYSQLSHRDRYAVARRLGRLLQRHDQERVLLIGPGRWGTTTPSLGVPVRFGEIAGVEAICEVMDLGEGVVPDVSLGTHFFNDLVEEEILYLAHHPHVAGHLFAGAHLLARGRPEAIQGIEVSSAAPIIVQVRGADLMPGGSIRLYADSQAQQVQVWVAPASTPLQGL